MNNGNDGVLLATAFGSMMGDQVFRNIIGFSLLQNEQRLDDGIGMALLVNDSNPFRDVNRFIPQPPRFGRH